MEKKVARAQPYLSQSSTVSPCSASKFNNNTNSAYFHSVNQSSNFQLDTGRSKIRAKHNTYSDRDSNYGRGKLFQSNRGGNGYQRRTPQYQPNNEVKESVDGEKEQTRVTRQFGMEKSSRRGESASHLLNFTYTRRHDEDEFKSRPRYQSGARYKHCQPHTKDQFLQAHCQFVVREAKTDTDYALCLADPDKMVEWESIEQVIMNDEQISSCPICLDVPVAAKITKCSHIYCWPCILHYLSLTDRKWAKCPICFDSIEAKDLKSVRIQASNKYKKGDEIAFVLMKREREALYYRPKSSWKASGTGHLYTLADDSDDVRYSKLLSAAVSDIESIISNERRQLLRLLQQEDTQSLEASFIQASLDNLNERLEKLSSCGKKSASYKKKEAEVCNEDLLEVTQHVFKSVKSDPQLKAVDYSNAFDDEQISNDDSFNLVSPTENSLESSNSSANPSHIPITISESSSITETTALSAVSAVTGDVLAKSGAVSIKASRNRNANSASSCDSGETELQAAHLMLPPTGTQPGHSSGSKKTEVYYFYQAADGQQIYLNSLNNRMLAAEYGSMEMAPQMLTATILDTEEFTMTLELRKRLKYLSHLPLYSQYTVCDVTLRPPIVSSNTLSLFTEEVNANKRKRNRRLRAEAKHNNRIQAEERRRMGKYPDLALPLNSDRHFPSSGVISIGEPSLSQTAATDGNITQHVVVHPEYSVPSRQHEVPLTTPYSFAQAMKGSSGAPAAVWPRVQGAATYIRSGGHQQMAQVSGDVVEQDKEEDGAAPTFQQSFSADFDEMFNRLSVDKSKKNEEENSVSGKQGKKSKDRKRKKQMVLFSTSGQRAN